jgi:hypothetical protein
MEQGLPAPGLVDQLVCAGVPSAAAIQLQTHLREGVRDTANRVVSGNPSVQEAVERLTLDAIERFGVVEASMPTREVSLRAGDRSFAELTGGRYMTIKWPAVLTTIVAALTTLQTELDPRQPVELVAAVLALAVFAELAYVKRLMHTAVHGDAAAVFWSLYERGTLEEGHAVTLEMLLPRVNSHQQTLQRSPMTTGDLRLALKPLVEAGCVGRLRHSNGVERWWLNDTVHVDLRPHEVSINKNADDS